MTLLPGNLFVGFNDSLYAIKIWADFGLYDWLGPPIARRLVVVPDLM